MKKLAGVSLVGLVLLIFFVFADGYPLSIVRHRWQEVITESNHAALRPGSVYDILTHFEQNSGRLRPQFKYLFFDTGLGAADPIYPVFQEGHQRSWPQLVNAGLSEKNRHIDHFSTGDTPEGCRIQSVYWVRHIDEFSDRYADLRADGYSLIDISFDYYVKLRPNAQCGKHHAHELSDGFDPFEAIYGYADKFRTFSDIPQELLAKYEAKVGVLKLIKETFKTRKDEWKSYDQAYTLSDNSMWFYPDGYAPDHGIASLRTQSGLRFMTQAKHLFWAAEPGLSGEFALPNTLKHEDFLKVVDFLKGKPTPDFDPKKEPGNDTLDVARQVTRNNFYTSGTTIESIEDVVGDISDPDHFKLVSVVLRPNEPERDIHFSGSQQTPQIRMVYQLMSPRFTGRAYEQLFIHLEYDAIDRHLVGLQRRQAIKDFLQRADAVIGEQQTSGPVSIAASAAFIRNVIGFRPAQTVSWSSSLTGLWVFGTLTRSFNTEGDLVAVPVIRGGVNVGFYSSAYDNLLFRNEIEHTDGRQRSDLQALLDDLTPQSYRDPRRHDPKTLTFDRVTCAQCHQMAGRDGIHVSLNDGLDRRIEAPYKATEYLFRELDRQLQAIPNFDENSVGPPIQMTVSPK